MRFATLCLLFAGSAVASAQESSPLTRRVRSVLAAFEPRTAAVETTSHPLVIRIHEKAFADAVGDRVDSVQPVSTVILGTPATGRSRTQGAIHVSARPANQSAGFLVSFRGRSYSQTVGVNGPARIYSRTATDFVVSRQVVFTPLKGFESGPTWVQTRTSMTLDDVQATKPGLRGRIIRRVGWRRASESRPAAERVADGNVRRQLQSAFDRQLDERVADLNRRYAVTRYAKALIGGSGDLDIQVSSSQNCIQLAVGRAGASGRAPAISSRCPDASIEVWLHDNPVGREENGVAEAWAMLATGMKSFSALQSLAMVAGQATGPDGVRARRSSSWTIVTFDPPAANAQGREIRVARIPTN